MSTRKKRSGRAPVVRAVITMVALVLAGALATAAAAAPPDAAANPLLQPIDEQNWVDQAGADVGGLHEGPA